MNPIPLTFLDVPPEVKFVGDGLDSVVGDVELIDGVELVDDVELAPALAAVEMLVLELVAAFGVLTKNQSAAIGAPNPVSSTNLVRLNPMRLKIDAVKLLKNGM